MEEEEILGVNLDELQGLFDNNSFLGGESFGWGLSPYKNVVLNEDGEMVKDDSVVLYIDALGDANLSSKLWMFKKDDPLDAYDEPVFSKNNLFVKGLSKVIPSVPPYGTMLIPWYRVESYDRRPEEIKFPDDTPPGFVPCNGYIIDDLNGREFRLPQLVSRTRYDDLENEVIEYIPPPGMAYMMRLPDGSDTSFLNARVGNNYVDFRGKLKDWGNPANPFSDFASLFYS